MSRDKLVEAFISSHSIHLVASTADLHQFEEECLVAPDRISWGLFLCCLKQVSL